MTDPDSSPLAWNRTLERELRDDVNSNLRVREQLFAQLWRMRQRGSLGRRPALVSPRKLAIGRVGRGFHVCAICERDCWTIGGDELILDATDDAVCWLCGDEHDPALTAEVLAKAVDDSEQWIASRFPDYFTHWTQLLRRFGMEQAAEDLEDKLGRYQEQVRRAKAEGLGHAETWLTPSN